MPGVSPVKKFIDVLNICYKTLVDQGLKNAFQYFFIKMVILGFFINLLI